MQPTPTTISRPLVLEALRAMGFGAGLALPLRSVSRAGRCVRVHFYLEPFLGTSVGDYIIQLEPLGFDASNPRECLDSARQTAQAIIGTDTNPGVVEAAQTALAELHTVVEPGAVEGLEFVALQATPSGKDLFRMATTDRSGRAVLANLFLDRPCTTQVFELELDKVVEPFESALEAFAMQGAFAGAEAEEDAEKFPAISGTLARWGYAYTLEAKGSKVCVLSLATPLEQKEVPPARILYLGAKHQLPLEWERAVGGGFVCSITIPIPVVKFAIILPHPLLFRRADP